MLRPDEDVSLRDGGARAAFLAEVVLSKDFELRLGLDDCGLALFRKQIDSAVNPDR